MAAIKLRDGAAFRPEGFFDWCERSRSRAAAWTASGSPTSCASSTTSSTPQTQKVLVRNLKKCHFDRRRLATEPIYWRRRGDEQFVPFTDADFASLREEFARAERAELLDR